MSPPRTQERHLIPVFTFVSDDSSYDEMLASFESAGFSSDIAMFNRLTSRGRLGEPEPYSTITELIESVQEPYFVLCHQDVRVDPGNGMDDLTAQLALLSGKDPRWAVAGNAGGSHQLRMVRRITDPHGGSTPDLLPARVQTLDEKFLVLRTGTGVGCSPGLHGFHLYGTDACMNARVLGFSAYVIDFHVHHLSGGKMDVDYERADHGFSKHGTLASTRATSSADGGALHQQMGADCARCSVRPGPVV